LPQAPVAVGPNGSLYGTTENGGSQNCSEGCGTVFNLKPPVTACRAALCPWSVTQLYAFTGPGSDGYYPGYGGVVFDSTGNLYDTTISGGSGEGTVYELTPSGPPWKEEVLYKFTGNPDGRQPYAGLIFDQSGSLYGTTYYGGSGYGTVYQLMPGSMWTEGVLYPFQDGVGNPLDGANPYGGLIF